MSLIISIPAMIVLRIGGDENFKLGEKILKKVVVWSIIMVGVGILVPNTKEMAAIYIIPKIANSKQVSQLPENLINLVNDWAKDQIAPKEQKK
jgi:hypothetical protein